MSRTIHFHRKHHDAVRRGEKVTTVRYPRAAHQRADTDMADFARQLRADYYPDMPDDAVVQVAVIALDATPPA